jgi:DMSO/TMAO reductase YedYZ molybdopterin-dependent catalytic subunit
LLARLAAGCDRLVVVDPRPASALEPITPNEQFYVFSAFGTPEFDGETHETLVLHEDTEITRFDLDRLLALPDREREHTLQCIGSRPGLMNVGNAVWGGLPLTEVLDTWGIAIPPSAVGLRLVGVDGYHAGLPIEDLASPIWLVWRMNGELLPADHGFPARLLVPGRYGVKNLKWLSEIAFVDVPHVSYWTVRGWSEDAFYKPNTFVVAPLDGEQISEGDHVTFVGTAFAGTDEIDLVEVSVDGGPYEPAALTYSVGSSVWTLWSWDWVAGAPGDHTIQVRCTTASGAQSLDDPLGTSPMDGYNGSMAVGVRVSG